MMCVFYQRYHLRKRLIGQTEHLMDMLVLLFGKVGTATAFTVDCARNIIAAITNTFYLGHLAQHLTNLHLTFKTQSSVGYSCKVIGDFHLHVITDVFVLLNAREELVEIILVFSMQ